MNALPKFSSLIVLCWVANVSHAQQPAPPAATPTQADAPAPADAPSAAAKPSKATAQSEAGEPRANTSKAASAQAEAGEPRANTSKPAAAAGARSNTAPGQKVAGSADRLELGTATVTGDREQPKVMYIVPWKKSDIGDLAGKPMNSLVDEILAPVDRDVFKREVVYYKAVQADSSQNGAPGRPSDQGEK
jgi:hypothetical protein